MGQRIGFALVAKKMPEDLLVIVLMFCWGQTASRSIE